LTLKNANYAALDAWDLREKYGLKKSEFNKNNEYHVCYKELAIGKCLAIVCL
jgi:hypothetical protein